MPYDVATAVYEGPFDLLLHLILREQVDIYEVSLLSIVDGYLAELDRMDEVDLNVATEFLLIAATLVELKSRRLLPVDSDLSLDEELARWEERDLLLARLVECKTFKDAAVALKARATEASGSWPRAAGLEDRFAALAPDLLAGVSPADVRDAFRRALTRPAPTLDLSHVAPIGANVDAAVEELLVALPRVGRTTFRDLTTRCIDRIEVVVRFLAVLELFKEGLVDLDQSDHFGALVVVWIGEAGADPATVTVDTYEG